VEKAIAGARAGSVIRIATYNFDLQSSADALAAAARRGARVFLVVDGGETPSGPLIREMRHAGVHVVRTVGTGRAGAGNMHMKLYLFSHTGTSRDVVMVGSANLASGSIERLWVDLETVVGNTTLYDGYVTVQRQLMHDRPVSPTYERFSSGPYLATVFPRPGTDHTSDDIWLALDAVNPAGAVIRVSMYTWSGSRGEDLANKLVELHQGGADVAVVHNGLGASVHDILTAGGVRLVDSRLDVDGDGVKDFYVHHKYLLIAQPQSSSWQTWTGSANWNTGSLRRADETTLRINGKSTYDAYLANWNHVVATSQ
jgi:phosphatidylserine/phosphatidylglycerophosphate/cardiolipin synthase-like enzyme